MPVTVAPSTEAMSAIVTLINAGSGGVYTLPTAATYTEEIIDPRESITALRVEVASEEEEQLDETLESEDRTSHRLRVWIRKSVDGVTNAIIDPLKLLTRQLFQRLNANQPANTRVKIWDVDQDQKQTPDKELLNQESLFVASIALRVEVEAS